MAAMREELFSRRHFLGSRPTGTLYLGGGTPSTLSTSQLGELLRSVSLNFDLSELVEFTIEANPEHLTQQYLEGLVDLWVNRLSIGVQSFNDEHLELMNRRHTGTQAEQAVRHAQGLGFDNISIDLIYGLPFMTDQQWIENIERAIALGVQHISAYHLSIEQRTVFYRRGMEPIDEKRSEWQYGELCTRLRGAGFEHYEISNFALPARRSKHNSGYWTGEPYLGIGPSAHSFDGHSVRSWNVDSNKLYVQGEVSQSETLTDRDKHNEYLMIRLRTADGINRAEYGKLFGGDFAPRGLFVVTEDRVFIDERDWLIADRLIGDLFR